MKKRQMQSEKDKEIDAKKAENSCFDIKCEVLFADFKSKGKFQCYFSIQILLWNLLVSIVFVFIQALPLVQCALLVLALLSCLVSAIAMRPFTSWLTAILYYSAIFYLILAAVLNFILPMMSLTNPEFDNYQRQGEIIVFLIGLALFSGGLIAIFDLIRQVIRVVKERRRIAAERAVELEAKEVSEKKIAEESDESSNIADEITGSSPILAKYAQNSGLNGSNLLLLRDQENSFTSMNEMLPQTLPVAENDSQNNQNVSPLIKYHKEVGGFEEAVCSCSVCEEAEENAVDQKNFTSQSPGEKPYMKNSEMSESPHHYLNYIATGMSPLLNNHAGNESEFSAEFNTEGIIPEKTIQNISSGFENPVGNPDAYLNFYPGMERMSSRRNVTPFGSNEASLPEQFSPSQENKNIERRASLIELLRNPILRDVDAPNKGNLIGGVIGGGSPGRVNKSSTYSHLQPQERLIMNNFELPKSSSVSLLGNPTIHLDNQIQPQMREEVSQRELPKTSSNVSLLLTPSINQAGLPKTSSNMSLLENPAMNQNKQNSALLNTSPSLLFTSNFEGINKALEAFKTSTGDLHILNESTSEPKLRAALDLAEPTGQVNFEKEKSKQEVDPNLNKIPRVVGVNPGQPESKTTNKLEQIVSFASLPLNDTQQIHPSSRPKPANLDVSSLPIKNRSYYNELVNSVFTPYWNKPDSKNEEKEVSEMWTPERKKIAGLK